MLAEKYIPIIEYIKPETGPKILPPSIIITEYGKTIKTVFIANIPIKTTGAQIP
jgi:hypothetical protein